MAELSGYNPGMSLLPAGSGTIQAMSGGSMGPPPGFDPTRTLIPASGGEIAPYKGGFFEEPISIGGAPAPPSDTTGNRATALAAAVEESKKATSVPITAITPVKTPGKPPVAPVTTSVTTPAPVTVDADKTASVKPVTPDSTPVKSGKKDIVLFGTPLTLEDPSIGTGTDFTKYQTEALTLFGLDGPGLSNKEKQEVLQALYDGKCNSDKPLGMLVNCEPVRRIVQSLALNLLSKLQSGDKNTTSNISKEEQPEVRFDKMGDGSMKVCITFKPNNLSLLSKYIPPSPANKKNKKNASNKPSGLAKPLSVDTGASITPSSSTVTSSELVPPPPPPAPPANSIKPIITESHTNNTITANWRNLDGVTYDVKLKTGSKNGSGSEVIGTITISGDNKTVTFEELEESTKYTVIVNAVKGATTDTGSLEVTTSSLDEELDKILAEVGLPISDSWLSEHFPHRNNIAAANAAKRPLTPEEQAEIDELIREVEAEAAAEDAAKTAAAATAGTSAPASPPITREQLRERLNRLLGSTGTRIKAPSGPLASIEERNNENNNNNSSSNAGTETTEETNMSSNDFSNSNSDGESNSNTETIGSLALSNGNTTKSGTSDSFAVSSNSGTQLSNNSGSEDGDLQAQIDARKTQNREAAQKS